MGHSRQLGLAYVSLHTHVLMESELGKFGLCLFNSRVLGHFMQNPLPKIDLLSSWLFTKMMWMIILIMELTFFLTSWE